MKYRGIFEYEYPTEHKPPISIDVHLHGDCVKGKIIEWEYRPLEKEPTTKNDLGVDCISRADVKAKKIYSHERHEYVVPVAEIDWLPSVTPQESCENNICDSCHTKGCIFQSGIKRVNCEFYTTQNEPCNDAISRESLLNKLCGYHVDIEKSIFDKLWRVIKDMPSVTPQASKTGHWMKSNIGGAKVCSVCNAHMGLSSFKFCPNCGARMVEPQESENP